jgi:hypothetical protein
MVYRPISLLRDSKSTAYLSSSRRPPSENMRAICPLPSSFSALGSRAKRPLPSALDSRATRPLSSAGPDSRANRPPPSSASFSALGSRNSTLFSPHFRSSVEDAATTSGGALPAAATTSGGAFPVAASSSSVSLWVSRLLASSPSSSSSSPLKASNSPSCWSLHQEPASSSSSSLKNIQH